VIRAPPRWADRSSTASARPGSRSGVAVFERMWRSRLGRLWSSRHGVDARSIRSVSTAGVTPGVLDGSARRSPEPDRTEQATPPGRFSPAWSTAPTSFSSGTCPSPSSSSDPHSDSDRRTPACLPTALRPNINETVVVIGSARAETPHKRQRGQHPPADSQDFRHRLPGVIGG
jgi:hypothetical protein